MLNTLPKFRSKALMYNWSHFLSASGLSAVCFGMRQSSWEFRFIPFQLISPATESCKHRLRLRVALGFPKKSGKSWGKSCETALGEEMEKLSHTPALGKKPCGNFVCAAIRWLIICIKPHDVTSMPLLFINKFVFKDKTLKKKKKTAALMIAGSH